MARWRGRLLAATCACLLGAGATAREVPTMEPATTQPASRPFEASRCEPEFASGRSAEESAACRRLWQERIALRSEELAANRERLIAEAAELRARGAVRKPVPVKLETFLQDALRYGDVVVITGGARVYVGADDVVPTMADFVELNSARSPHRRHVGRFGGALAGATFSGRKAGAP